VLIITQIAHRRYPLTRTLGYNYFLIIRFTLDPANDFRITDIICHFIQLIHIILNKHIPINPIILVVNIMPEYTLLLITISPWLIDILIVSYRLLVQFLFDLFGLAIFSEYFLCF
jgi:hypothetical protein